MWIALAGLPGTGKTTLARALAPRVGGVVLSKDEVREELFAGAVAYTPEQDDVVFREVLERAAALPGVVLLDGRTFTRAECVHEVVAFARARGRGLRWVECVCAPEVARARLADEGAAHVAADRGPALYDRLAAEREPLPVERMVVRTDEGSAEELAARLATELDEPWTEGRG
jgi:predicted kinase